MFIIFPQSILVGIICPPQFVRPQIKVRVIFSTPIGVIQPL